MSKIVAVLYPGGEKAKQVPELLGCAENALGLRSHLEAQGHTLITTTQLDHQFDQHLADAEIVITTPFWPAYIDRKRVENAKNLKMILTAGVGSDHIDLKAAAEHHVTVAEITGSNVVSVAEHTVMQILILVRNFLESYQNVINGGWNIGQVASKIHDLEGKTVGLIGMGRIGERVAHRLKPFDVDVIYYDNRHLSTVEEQFLNVRYQRFEQVLAQSDIVSIHCPLTPATQGLFDQNAIGQMKKNAYLVNTARGAIVNTNDLVKALESGHLAGYAGDVWYPQPAPKDHPWRQMPNHAMTPHVSGTPLEAQKRYADGIQKCLDDFFAGKPLDRDFIIVENGEVLSPSYRYAYH